MYVGRIACIAMTGDGRLCASYRVSSRSFPNRTAVIGADKVSIVPKKGHERDILKNPYIAYNCVRLVCGWDVAIVTNGSQSDPIAEKIAMGVPPRDAIVATSLALDYEKDQYNTPRVSAVADKRDNSGWLGVVRDDGLEVREMPIGPGAFFYVATYEENSLSLAQGGEYLPTTAQEACEFILGGGVFADREKPVTAVAAMGADDGFELVVMDAPPA